MLRGWIVQFENYITIKLLYILNGGIIRDDFTEIDVELGFEVKVTN